MPLRRAQTDLFSAAEGELSLRRGRVYSFQPPRAMSISRTILQAAAVEMPEAS